MLKRTRRLVVEEEVTEVFTPNSLEAWVKQHLEQRERMKSEQNRLDSFDSRRLLMFELDVSVRQRLAKAGFYCWSGGIECFSCGLNKSVYFWQEGHDPETVHREERPNCKFITGQSDNVPIDVKQQNKIQSVNQPSLPSVSQPDKPQEEEIYKLEPLKDKIKNQIEKDTSPNKGQIQPEREINDKYTKTIQNRKTEQRTVSWGDAEEIISGSKRRDSERSDVKPRTASPTVVPFTSSGNHTAAQNVYQQSVAVTRSSSSDVSGEKSTSRRDTKAGTPTTYEELEKKGASESTKEKTVSAITSRSSDVREKSVTSPRSHQEHFTSESSRDVAHTWNIGNGAFTDSDDSDVNRIKPFRTRRKHFTCAVSSDMTFKGSVHSLVHIAVSSLKDLF